MLSDPRRNITLKSFTQMIFIPLQIITSLESDTSKDYEKRGTGFAVTLGAAMSQNLDVSKENFVKQNKSLLHFPQTPHYEWHKTYTTIDRIDMIINAAKTLASIYKLEIQSKVPAEPKDDAKQDKK